MFSLLLQVRFSILLSPSSLESSQLQIQRTKLYTAAQRRRSLSKTGYSRTTSPILQISCHVGMCKQTYISFFFLIISTCMISLLQIPQDFLISSNATSCIDVQFLQGFIPQKFEIIWLSNMKNTWFLFCSSSPFLFLVETPSMAQISVPADSVCSTAQPGHQWVTRPGHSHLPHPSKGCGLLTHQQTFLHPFYSSLYTDHHFSSLFLKSFFSAHGNWLLFPPHVVTMLQN